MDSCRSFVVRLLLLTLAACGGGGGYGGSAGGGYGGWTAGGAGGGSGMPSDCTAAPVASSTVRTSVTNITVRPNAVVSMNMKHKLDIDPVEDGCVTTFSFDIRLHPSGCDLR